MVGVAVAEEWLAEGDRTGPLTVCAILRGTPAAALRHRLKEIQGTVWERIADKVSGASNGNTGERILQALAGCRLAGMDEDMSRRHCLGQIARWDSLVDEWLLLDPVVSKRGALPRKNMEDVDGILASTTWLWEPWIPRGYLSMIVGRPGAGKSFVAAWVGTNAILGGTYPDGQQAVEDREKAEILWLDTESTQGLLRERLQVLASPKRRFWWPTDPRDAGNAFPAVNLGKDYWLGLVADHALHHRPCWIVVDSLRGSHQADENSSDVQAMLSGAAAIARDVGCGFTFIHHLRKAQHGESGEVTLDMVRGSTAIVAMMRSVIAIDQPDSTQTAVRMRVIKSNLAGFPKPLGLSIDERGPIRLDEAPQVQRTWNATERAVEFLLATLNAGPRVTQEVMAEAESQGITRRAVERARDRLRCVSVKIEGHWEMSLPVRDGQSPF